MILFFRRIRQALIGSASGRRYLLYAIGEILLVMIGILLALQVNNWNENRKERIMELNLVKTLYNELIENIEYTENRIERLATNEKSTFELSNLFGLGERDITLDSLTKIYVEAVRMPLLRLQTSTFNRVINNEEFNLIQFDSLKLLLNIYKPILEVTNKNWNYFGSDSFAGRPGTQLLGRNGISRLLGEIYAPQSPEWAIVAQIKKSELRNYSVSDILADPDFESWTSLHLTILVICNSNLNSILEINIRIRDFIERHYRV